MHFKTIGAAFAACALALVTGCSWTDRHGTRHVAIVGFGIVSVTNQQGALVQDVRGIGLVVDESVNLGLVQRHRVEIDPNYATNLVVSVKATPLGLVLKNFEANYSSAMNSTNNITTTTP
jgi:hypothetical protein